MASPLLLALLLIAGSAPALCENALTPGMPYIDIADIIASIPDIIASLPGIIADIDWREVLDRIQSAIQSIPDVIDRLPEIIDNLPIDLPSIIENVIDRLPDNVIAAVPGIVDRLRDIIARLPEILDRIREIASKIPDYVDIPAVVASASRLVERIRDYVTQIDWQAISNALSGIDWSIVVDTISNIISNFPDNISNLPEIIANLPEIIANLPDVVANLPIDWAPILDQLPNFDRDPGTVASIQEFPSLVQIEVGFSNFWLQACTGSILTSRYVISSGRCFSGLTYAPSIRRILAGANTRGGAGNTYPISSATVHPSFGSNGFDGDLSIVRVDGVIAYGPNVQPISITSQGVFFPAGVRLTNAGWGSVAQGRNIANRDLHKADLYVVDNSLCRDIYNNYAVSLTVTTNMICAGRAGSGGRMSDLRDGGGPLYYDGILVGTISFGRIFGNDSLPVVATSISSYTNWIVSNAS